MPSKKYYFFWFVSIFFIVAFLINEFRPLTFGEARRLAIARLKRYTSGDVIKYSFLKGPEPTTPPSGIPYAFEWSYGQDSRYYVWVEKSGRTHVTEGGSKGLGPWEY
jgi:hypothetical protein